MASLKKQIINDFNNNWYAIFPKEKREIITKSKKPLLVALVASFSFAFVTIATLVPILTINILNSRSNNVPPSSGGVQIIDPLIFHIGDKYVFRGYPDNSFAVSNVYLKENHIAIKINANLPFPWEIKKNNRPSCSLTLFSGGVSKFDDTPIVGFLDKNNNEITRIEQNVDDDYYLRFDFPVEQVSDLDSARFDFTNYSGEYRDCFYDFSYSDFSTI